ncbi:MAG: acyloxyacyl hydrolase [Candidatus Omnitrophica bacterium]|nr:acyloxyacyl hydrolase [Candidatus Omnitrophota bacterium]
MRALCGCFFIAVLGIFFVASLCLAQEPARKSFQGVGFHSGWGQANLKSKADYNFTPLLVDFDFRLNKLLEFQIEPLVAFVYQPNQNNIEIGNSFLLKASMLPENFRFRPYIKLGLGVVYMTQHLSEQSTQFNFTEHIGAGASHFFTKSCALNLEFRFRHTSNGGIRKPNNGIDAYLTLAGLSYKF